MKKNKWLKRVSIIGTVGVLTIGLNAYSVNAAIGKGIQKNSVKEMDTVVNQLFQEKKNQIRNNEYSFEQATTASLAAMTVTQSAMTATGDAFLVNKIYALETYAFSATQAAITATESAMTATQAAITATESAMTATQAAMTATESAITTKKEKPHKKTAKLAVAKKGKFVYVRKSASKNSKAIAKLYKGATGKIVQKKKKWIKIKSGKITGYVARKMVAIDGSAEKLALKEASKKVELKEGTITLNVRKKKSKKSSIVAQIPEEKAYNVKSESSKWIKIQLKSGSGYVAKEFVDINYKFKTAKAIIKKKKISHVSEQSKSAEDTANNLIDYAKGFIGNPYVWGGTSLTKGTDCSGYTMRIFEKYGYSLPRTSVEQSGVGQVVDLKNMKPGDLVFFKKKGRVHHVAIYIGDGRIVHAAGKKWGIIISNLKYSKASSARRILK